MAKTHPDDLKINLSWGCVTDDSDANKKRFDDINKRNYYAPKETTKAFCEALQEIAS